ncbi:MAG: type 1 glutamine amidotransferase [Deltaproteobacteria bacterium]|nr:type 1 glutamine amidotransferase [Deltaproteobacteria bacterium]
MAEYKDRDLSGKKVAILATDGFEQSELMEPLDALEESGAEVSIVAPKGGSIRGWDEKQWGESLEVDIDLNSASADDFDALVLPGGVMSPDKLRIDRRATEFAKQFVESGKPVGAICHGPWTLINAGCVSGRRMTSYKSLEVDLINAGAHWVDEEVVVDNGLVTSREPRDLPAFIDKLKEEISEGQHQRRTVSESSMGRTTI